MAAKRTAELDSALSSAAGVVCRCRDHRRASDGFDITATVRTTAQTGVEMEALTAVSVAALTLYDMIKAVDKTMEIGEIRLLEKRGGRSGEFRAGT